MVWLAPLNVQHIQSALKTRQHPFTGGGGFGKKQKRLYLHTVPSATQREQVYDRASKALLDIETSLLPTYGGRCWKVQVTIADPNTTLAVTSTMDGKRKGDKNSNSKKKMESPYFVFGNKGVLELAAWPYILLRIPKPPKFQGYYSTSQTKKSAAKQRKKPQQLSEDCNTSSPKVVPEEEDDGDKNDDPIDEEEEQDDDEEEGLAIEVEDEEELELIYDLQEREVTPLSSLAYQERWRVPLPTVTTKWISPLREVFHTRKTAWNRAVELCKHEVRLEKALHGYDAQRNRCLSPSSTAVLSAKKALEVGWLRFQRDGLWVVGQEEQWKEDCGADEDEEGNDQNHTTARARPLSGRQYYIQCNRLSLQAQRQQQQHQEQLSIDKKEKSSSQAKRKLNLNDTEEAQQEVETTAKSTLRNKKFTLRNADDELRETWKSLSDTEQLEWKQKSCQHFENERRIHEPEQNPSTHGRIEKEGPKLEKISAATTTTRTSTTENNALFEHAITVPETPEDGSCVLEVTYVASKNDEDNKNNNMKKAAHDGRVTPSSAEGEEELSVHEAATATLNANKDTMEKHPCTVASVRVTPITSKPKTKTSIRGKTAAITTLEKPAPWTKWCLTADQVQQCYDAGMEHYDTVIATVKARDLHRELQDGFDVLRERGRGRFDMELPVFDTPAFHFMTQLTLAPWMPAVRQILGKDVVLIHKGMFLSMPGSEAQPYHQDGVHLTTQTQRDCHALNVFVPLVDLTMKHGPTEFCLGTHILEQEEFNAKFAETPLVKAGTPILFDYRLGHKGLANTSGTCRPIVYCTYAKSGLGKGEFRDKVNFSRSRYHRIGNLVSHKQVPSREERAEKRQQRIIEERLQNELEEVIRTTTTTTTTDSNGKGRHERNQE